METTEVGNGCLMEITSGGLSDNFKIMGEHY